MLYDCMCYIKKSPYYYLFITKLPFYLCKNMILLLGTAKGLIVYEKKNRGWHISTVHFLGFPVSMVFVDERTNTWWAGLPHRHWGQKLHCSIDKGKTWEQVTTPRYPTDALLKNGKPASLKLIWCMAGGGAERPNELWLGTEPGGLFRSTDGGQSFQLVESLWNHPSRSELWFGAGKDDPFIHSIVVDPFDSDHVYIAVSCAGIFETTDAGETWQPRNQGLKATYLPNPTVEVGHDPHLLLASKTGFFPHLTSKTSDDLVLWQQNHCGIFRSTDGGKHWEDVSDKNGIAHYGFALAVDDANPLRAWVIPAISDEMRVAHDLALCVCRTEDGGKTWQPLRKGLPQKGCFDIVFRHSLDICDSTLVFGTTTGNLYVSDNWGDAWQCINHHLPRIDAVQLT